MNFTQVLSGFIAVGFLCYVLGRVHQMIKDRHLLKRYFQHELSVTEAEEQHLDDWLDRPPTLSDIPGTDTLVRKPDRLRYEEDQ